MNPFIRLREAVIDTVLSINEQQVLNAGTGTAPTPTDDGVALAAALKQAMQQFKAQAMDEEGKLVAYQRLRNDPAYLAYRSELTPQLQQFDPVSLPDRAARLAFWINLYNALVIDAVIAFGITTSVADQWLGLRFFRAAAYQIGGLRCSLDDIEHGILRANRGHPFIPGPQFAAGDPRLRWNIDPPDPRIHFALNCASLSCPPIGVYRTEQIDQQLDLALRAFVAADVAVDPVCNEIHLSRIFDWYREDFGGTDGVIQLLRQALPDDERRAWLLQARQARLIYRPYDWRLNLA